MNREALIVQAIVFLQSSAAIGSKLSEKLNFLESKGLTPTEVQEALRRAGKSIHLH